MKKKILLTTIVGSMLLCSCSLFKTYSTNTQNMDVYLLETAIKKDDYAHARIGTIPATFIDGEKYIPYFTLEQYASLYDPYLPKGATNEVTYEGNTATWKISVNGQLYFLSAISSGTVLKAGEIANALDDSIFERDTEALSYRTKYTGDAVPLSLNAGYANYEFDTSAFKHFKKDGKTYYPLGFYDITYSNSSSVYHFYNYKNIYVTQDADNFAKEFTNGAGVKTSSDKEMEEITKGESIPGYLINYNANLFIYMMENFYGMKTNYGISSIKSFLKSQGFYSGLFSSNDHDRGEAYSGALSAFDDNHTVFVSANGAWGEQDTRRYGGPRMLKRSALKAKLLEQKKKMLANYFDNEEYDYERGQWADTIMSDSKKTAMFYFDQFTFGENDQVFNKDKSIKEGAEQYDSYFNFLKRLRSYENKGIENIIIDVSTNGGGVVGVMARLLALLSKNNSSDLCLVDESSMVASVNTVSVDANEDGQYTENETFGNKFNFYILTSDCSYSCGNAFPCYAQKMGIKIIGENSGGGECAVNIHYMPNSEYIYHSSRLHLGSYDKDAKQFTGFEPGAKPDFSLVPAGHKSLLEEGIGDEYIDNIPSNFYDINYLESLIAAK